jgi:ribosomal protein L13
VNAIKEAVKKLLFTTLIKVKTMVLTKTKIIDGRDHLLGRLASVVAKELLAGQTIVIVRCDEIAVSGSCKFTSIVCLL